MFADQDNENTYDNEFNINFDNDALQLEAVEFVIDYIEDGMDHDDIEFESVADILSTYDIGIKRDETFSTHQPEFEEPGSPNETIWFEFNEQGKFLLNEYITAGYDRSALYAS